jgi:hypothetical protein
MFYDGLTFSVKHKILYLDVWITLEYSVSRKKHQRKCMVLISRCLQSFQNLARFDEWHSFLQNVYLLLFLFPTFLLESFLSEILTRKTYSLLIKEWQNRILFIEGRKKVIKISGKASYAIAFLLPFVLCSSHLFIYLFWIEKRATVGMFDNS